jgi:hypothetical protein
MNGRTYMWIGLAEVVAHEKCDVLKEGYAAFVSVVAKAPNAEAFYNTVKDELDPLRLRLTRMENVEHLSDRRRKHTLPSDLEVAIDYLSSTRRLAFGSFHTFRNSDLPSE